MNGGSHVQTGRRISQRTRSLPRTGNCAGSRRDCDQHRRDWLQHANGARSRRRSSDGIEFGSVGHPALPRLKCDRQNSATAVGGEHLRPARVPFRHPSSSGRWPGRWFFPLGQRPISPQPIHALEAHLMEHRWQLLRVTCCAARVLRGAWRKCRTFGLIKIKCRSSLRA